MKVGDIVELKDGVAEGFIGIVIDTHAWNPRRVFVKWIFGNAQYPVVIMEESNELIDSLRVLSS